VTRQPVQAPTPDRRPRRPRPRVRVPRNAPRSALRTTISMWRRPTCCRPTTSSGLASFGRVRGTIWRRRVAGRGVRKGL